ncbi:MAG: hypothetical protein JWR75_1221 [Devosia sp.]|nr:hypothetical protein [Devosia sp.]
MTFDIHARRPFIDGIRAIAVTAVVAFHVGLPFVGGGYVGVDIFFVISGFLIMGQIWQDRQAGTFSFAAFWARRAIRILPAYLLVIAASALIAPFILVFPRELESFGNEILYSAAMAANHLFLSQEGYFNGAAEIKPLLHLWSLAVEEQFYLVAPLVLFTLWPVHRRFGHGLAPAVLTVLLLVSFALCVLFTGPNATVEINYSFYLTPLRCWEFVAGGLVAMLLARLPRLPRLVSELGAIVGLALVLGAIVFFTAKTPFPSFWAAIPVVGTAMLILFASTHPNTVVAKVLALPPLVGIGLISYAWYLWHWPLLVFGRIYNFGESSLPMDLAMGGVSLVLAVHTYLWIERPIKAWRKRARIELSWGLVGIGIVALLHAAVLGSLFTGVISPSVARTLTAATLPPPTVRKVECSLGNPDDGVCGAVAGLNNGLIWGDSHAREAFATLRSQGVRHDAHLYVSTASSCPAILGATITINETVAATCTAALKNTESLLVSKAADLQFAILYARWNIYTPWTGPSAGGSERVVISGPGDASGEAAFVAGLQLTFERLRQQGVERILVVGPTPELKRQAADCVLRATRYGLDLDSTCSIKRTAVDARRRLAIDWLAKATADQPMVRFVDPLSLFCDGTWCRPYADGATLFSDDDHLSAAGVERLYEGLQSDFNWAFGDPPAATAP